MLKRSIALAIASAFVVCGAQAQAPASKTIKMQSTWPASNTLQEHFKMFGERVDKLTQGAIKIDAMPGGQIVPPFEVLDATNKKVLDGWHSISYYWVGKNPAAALFAGPPGGPFGMDHMDWLGWLYVGGGLEMWRDFYQNDLKLNLIVWPAHPSSPQALGWFKKPLKSVADFKGLKCRQTGLNAEVYAKLGQRILRTPPDILLAWLKAWDEVGAENSAKSPTFKKVYESQRAYAAKVVPAKRYMFPPYSFAANYYWPQEGAPGGNAKKAAA